MTATDWDWEGNVVAAVVEHFQVEGWAVLARADTASHEHGVDLLLERAGRLIAMEIKGYPSATYIRGARAGQPKRWPHPQARSYFGDLLLSLLLLRDVHPDACIAAAVPNRPTFRALVERVKGALLHLGIGAYLVHQDGRVETLLEPRDPTWPASPPRPDEPADPRPKATTGSPWSVVLERYRVPRTLLTRARGLPFEVHAEGSILQVTPSSGIPRTIGEREFRRTLSLAAGADQGPLQAGTRNSSYVLAIASDLDR